MAIGAIKLIAPQSRAPTTIYVFGWLGDIIYTKIVYALFVKNVTISLSDSLLEKGREYARSHGKSFNQFVRETIAAVVDDGGDAAIIAMFEEADRLARPFNGPIPNRDERNAR